MYGAGERENVLMSDEESGVTDPPESLGAVVHGPIVLGRAPGIAVGLRCIFGYPSGLSLQVVLRARGVQAEAAARRSEYAGVGYQGHGSTARRPQELLSVDVAGRLHPLSPVHTETSSGDDVFDHEATYWLSPLPRERELVLVVAWPQAGLPEQTCRLTLGELHDLSERVLPLS